MYKQLDVVILKNGNPATILEYFAEEGDYLIDEDIDNKTVTKIINERSILSIKN